MIGFNLRASSVKLWALKLGMRKEIPIMKLWLHSTPCTMQEGPPDYVDYEDYIMTVSKFALPCQILFATKEYFQSIGPLGRCFL